MGSDQVLLPYRLRTVRTGVQATYLVVGGLTAYAFLPHDGEIATAPYLVLMGVAAAGGVVIGALPWSRLFSGPWGMRCMYAWSLLDIALITAVVAVTGGHRSDLFWIYTLTAFFMAASYPARAQVALLAVTYAFYLGALAVAGSPLVAGGIVVRFAILGVLTFMASFLSKELMSQMAAHRQARDESEHRSTLIATVAEAARSMSTLDSEHVLDSVIDGAIALGLDAANFGFFDESADTVHVSHARGLPDEYVQRSHPASAGMTGLVRRSRRTETLDDYSTLDTALPVLKRSGFKAVIGTPVWVQGELDAVLVGGTHRSVRFTKDEIEAFELLASQAGRAIENARRFEAERRTVERLVDLDRMKQDFLSNVSHELRTPLTAILGMSDTLLDRWNRLDDSKRHVLIERVSANAHTLDDVISTLLDFSRLEAGKIEISPTETDVGALVAGLADRLEPLFDGSLGVVADDGLVVWADRRLLERVVENLLSNAAKHTPPHTPVRVTATGDETTVAVSVRDAGPGIPTHELRHLGERFYRGGDTDTRATRGTGLGLAFVEEVLAMHGSRLEVVSEVGSGATFTFRMPRRSAGAIEISAPPTPEAASA